MDIHCTSYYYYPCKPISVNIIIILLTFTQKVNIGFFIMAVVIMARHSKKKKKRDGSTVTVKLVSQLVSWFFSHVIIPILLSFVDIGLRLQSP